MTLVLLRLSRARSNAGYDGYGNDGYGSSGGGGSRLTICIRCL